MTLTSDFAPKNIIKQIEKTDIKGKHLIFIDDYSSEELENIFKTAELLEPFSITSVTHLLKTLDSFLMEHIPKAIATNAIAEKRLAPRTSNHIPLLEEVLSEKYGFADTLNLAKLLLSRE